eukprot:Partr_v1_DN26856_c0_g1_i1_m40945 putative ESF1, nucleolar pre-rRNA processing protein, homolog (S. cerevisiae)
MGKDSRFARIEKDPRFQRPKKKQTQVQIDSRFASMMTDEAFGARVERVDKYGRRSEVVTRKTPDLKKFYRLEDEHEDEQEDEFSDIDALEAELEGEIAEDMDDEDDKRDYLARLARGEIECKSSSESEEEDDVHMGDGILKITGESVDVVDQDESEFEDLLETENIPHGDSTKRIAIVNMDWDNVCALDLLQALDGFKPNTGVILKVSIYPSEFGKERIATENKQGPPAEIFKKVSLDGDEEQFDEEEPSGPLLVNDDGADMNTEALRKYQLERLRYYYAVVECDSVHTAQMIFNECDGSEFERSSVCFDMRFIPEDMVFEDEPKDVATEVSASYQPHEFVTHVLQHSNPKLTWDEDDPVRLKVTQRKFTNDDLKAMDFDSYLASATDSESESEIRKRYKKLMSGKMSDDSGEDQNSDADDDRVEGEMEITFAPGLTGVGSKLLSQKTEKESRQHETVFETQRRERKEKKKQRKNVIADKDDALVSDGEHSDLDTFFEEPVAKTNKAKKKRSEKTSEKTDPALELLMMDEENDTVLNLKQSKKKHFDYDEITKAETKSQRKKSKKRAQKDEGIVDDTFKVNTADSRFDALYTSSQFALDPTNSKFRPTKAMKDLVNERKKRQRFSVAEDAPPLSKNVPVANDVSSDISKLAERLKKKARQMNIKIVEN